jgi:DNA-binding winged helix-turn-helix (wHTH) protein/tetratricopeptide (TPR) repeat protein
MHDRIGTDARPIDLATLQTFERGDVRFHPTLRTLTGPAGAVTVEPRIMQLMVALAEAPGEVVPKDQLLARCWDGLLVGEDSLHRAAAGARRVLREANSAAVSIETIPKLGYRMLVAGSDVHPDPMPSAAPHNQNRRRVLAAAFGGALAVGGLSLLTWRSVQQRRDPKVEVLIGQSEQALRLAEPAADRQGVGFLKEALRISPDDALAWGRLALALRSSAEFAPPPRALALLADAEAAAKRALTLEPGQIDARAALALLRPVFGNWLEAEAGLRAVLDDAPDHLPALDGLSFVQASAGLVTAHYPLRLRTVKLDPLHAGYNFRSIYAHWMNGALAAADRAGERGLELWPRHFATWMARAGLFAMTGRPERTLAMLADEATRPDLPPQVQQSFALLAEALMEGVEPARRSAVDRLDRMVAGGGPLMAVNASMFLCALGEPARALDICEAYLLERGPVMAGTAWQPGQMLHNDIRRRFTNYLFTPVMSSARADPRFGRIMRDIGLSDYWRRSGHRPDYLAGRPLP